MSMENQIKWADVAHYYQFADIEIQIGIGQRKFKGVSQHDSVRGGAKRALFADSGGIFVRSTQYEISEYKPILRHCDDITEAEDNDYMLVHTQWVEESDLRRVILSLAKQHKTFDQYSTHWLISRGFDVFGLIESGQAIRKEASNGQH